MTHTARNAKGEHAGREYTLQVDDGREGRAWSLVVEVDERPAWLGTVSRWEAGRFGFTRPAWSAMGRNRRRWPARQTRTRKALVAEMIDAAVADDTI